MFKFCSKRFIVSRARINSNQVHYPDKKGAIFAPYFTTKKGSLLYRFFIAQLENPTYRDWVSQVLEDLEILEISLEIEEIHTMKIDKFKHIVKKAVKEKAFLYLL